MAERSSAHSRSGLQRVALPGGTLFLPTRERERERERERRRYRETERDRERWIEREREMEREMERESCGDLCE